MLSERKGGNLKSQVVFFYNRHLCAVIVEIYIQAIPQINGKKKILQWGKSGPLKSNTSVFHVCICNLRLDTLWIRLKT